MPLKARGQAEPQGPLCEGEGDPRKENEKGQPIIRWDGGRSREGSGWEAERQKGPRRRKQLAVACERTRLNPGGMVEAIVGDPQ